MVSKELLNELKNIIKEEYGPDLSMAEISKIGNGLVNAFDILAKIGYAGKHNS